MDIDAEQEVFPLGVNDREMPQNLFENPEMLLQFLLTAWASNLNVPYAHMDSLLRVMKIFVSSLLQPSEDLFQFNLPKFPQTIKTIFSRYGLWDARESFEMFICCANGHLVKQSSVIDDKHQLVGANRCASLSIEGEECGEPLLKEIKSVRGKSSYHPLKSVPFRGFIRHLKKLFKKKSFVKSFDQWKHLPNISPTIGDISDSQRWMNFRSFLDEDGFRVLLQMGIDWCAAVSCASSFSFVWAGFPGFTCRNSSLGFL